MHHDEKVNFTGVGADSDQGHLSKKDWVSDLGQNRPKAARSMGMELSQVSRPKWV